MPLEVRWTHSLILTVSVDVVENYVLNVNTQWVNSIEFLKLIPKINKLISWYNEKATSSLCELCVWKKYLVYTIKNERNE